MKLNRVEKHFITSSNEYYTMLDNFCFSAKNLYNHGNYIVRQEFIKNSRYIRFEELDKILKKDLEYPDYKDMPLAASAQQTLRQLDKNWTSFFSSIKEYKAHPEKYLGRPKLPKYAKKNGRNVLTLTNQNVKLEDGILTFPKVFNGLTCKFLACNKDNFVKITQVQFVPRHNHIELSVGYEIEVKDLVRINKNYIAIDIGVDNLATVTNSFSKQPFIINGKPLKSINQYYNKQKSKYQGIAKQMNGLDYTKRIDKLTERRNQKIEDYLHKASRKIIEYCKKNNVSKIVIGNNKEWKQGSELSKRVNQNFVQIPHSRLIEMIEYKAKEIGITVIKVEESYTSGTSFVDGEKPIKEYYNKSRRIKRGLFKVSDGSLINADVNGSYQIMKKVVPNEEILWNRGRAYLPFVVSIS